MLLVFNPVSSAILTEGAHDGGALVATYIATGGGSDFAPLPMAVTAPASLVGCQAYLMTMQRIAAASKDEEDKVDHAGTFEELIEYMFPSGLNVRESLLRLLPEYLGPIPITK
ncbi:MULTISPECIES: hypothetical protein [Caballeronia]|uniref:Uncharacterized protein n=1 Tax=Caballeronia jiangsuensis TaxID=1458357 RepID=A0ABW9CVJ4_9BURK|nr:hypothetical protein [Caballeronia sp. GaOx3]